MTHYKTANLGGGHFDNLKQVYYIAPSTYVTAQTIQFGLAGTEVNKLQISSYILQLKSKGKLEYKGIYKIQIN